MEPFVLICIITVIALLLFAVEALITPGFGVAGVGATLCVIVADSLIYYYYGGFAATLALLISTAVVLLIIWWLSRGKTLSRIALQTNISATNATREQRSVHPGDEGVALTRLALIGNASIAGHTVEVKSSGSFIEEGTPIVVTAVREAQILVSPRTAPQT